MINNDQTEPRYETQPELALVALLELLTRYASTAKPALAAAALQQLRVIAAEPELPDSIRQCARAITGDWQQLAVPVRSSHLH